MSTSLGPIARLFFQKRQRVFFVYRRGFRSPRFNAELMCRTRRPVSMSAHRGRGRSLSRLQHAVRIGQVFSPTHSSGAGSCISSAVPSKPCVHADASGVDAAPRAGTTARDSILTHPAPNVACGSSLRIGEIDRDSTSHERGSANRQVVCLFGVFSDQRNKRYFSALFSWRVVGCHRRMVAGPRGRSRKCRSKRSYRQGLWVLRCSRPEQWSRQGRG